ncbi:MAG: hypothetical protein HY537_09630 [Deltaproteobacteria bacterium]|nr:hypothetical protein [Deltaproteobacteria bacterium]
MRAACASSSGVSVRQRPLPVLILSRRRSLPHWERKFYHALMGISCFWAYAYLIDRQTALWLLVTLGGSLVTFDALRFYWPKVNRVALRVFGKVMRREELKSLSGNSFYIAGLALIVWLFPKPIVLLAVIFLAVGDPAAAIIGTLYGKRRLIGKKSLEGALANFVVSGAATMVVALAYFKMPISSSFALALVGAFVSTISELLPIPLDDNFTVPVVGACLLATLNSFLHFFS